MSTGSSEETNQKLISNCLQNEIESKRAEFKTLTVISIMYIIYWPKQEIKIDFFVCKKRPMTNELLATNEIMQNSRNPVSFHKITESKLFENLNDEIYNIDAYVCNLQIKLRWNELLFSQEIVNRHFERKECFSAASCKVLWEFLMEAKVWFSLSDAYRIIISMPMLNATYSVKVEIIISEDLTAVL